MTTSATPSQHDASGGAAGKPGQQAPGRGRPPGRVSCSRCDRCGSNHRGGRGRVRHRPPSRRGRRPAAVRHTRQRLDQPRQRDAADPAAARPGARLHPHRPGGQDDEAVGPARQGGGAGVHGPALHRHLPDRVAGVRGRLSPARAGRAQRGVHRDQREPVPRVGGRHGRLLPPGEPEHHSRLAFLHRADAAR